MFLSQGYHIGGLYFIKLSLCPKSTLLVPLSFYDFRTRVSIYSTVFFNFKVISFLFCAHHCLHCDFKILSVQPIVLQYNWIPLVKSELSKRNFWFLFSFYNFFLHLLASFLCEFEKCSIISHKKLAVVLRQDSCTWKYVTYGYFWNRSSDFLG